MDKKQDKIWDDFLDIIQNFVLDTIVAATMLDTADNTSLSKIKSQVKL